MVFCENIDYAGRDASMIELYRYPAVTRDEIATLREVLSPVQLVQVTEGDSLHAYIVDNRIEGVVGLLTIWDNRPIACLDTGFGAVWGAWDRDRQVLVTDDAMEAEGDGGAVIRGKTAYNSHGVKGIFSGGIFHTISADDPCRAEQYFSDLVCAPLPVD